jgi:hypothetical protein
MAFERVAEAGIEHHHRTHDLSYLFKLQSDPLHVTEPKKSEGSQGGSVSKMEDTVWDTTKPTGTNMMSVSRGLSKMCGTLIGKKYMN